MSDPRAPSDEACARAWDKIMRLAREHALVTAAYGGIAELAMPDEQRRAAGVREMVLRMHAMREATP